MAAHRRSEAPPRTWPPDADPRTRLLETAYALFSRDGIHAVGIDRIIAEAGVAKMTLYRHFASKTELVLAFLELRDQRWTHGWLEVEIERRAGTPEERLVALFDALDGWFRRPNFESCSFMRTLLEVPDESDPIHQATVNHLDTIQKMIARHARQAGITHPRDAASQLQILMMGAIVSATRGDRNAARRARASAERVLEKAARVQ